MNKNKSSIFPKKNTEDFNHLEGTRHEVQGARLKAQGKRFKTRRKIRYQLMVTTFQVKNYQI